MQGMKDYSNLNKTRREVALNAVKAAAGLFLFSCGVYLTIQANIGVAPWDVLNQGLAKHSGLMYGTILMLVSCTVLLVDVLMKEPIGLGMVLDTLITGKTVDLLNWLNLVPPRQTLWGGVICLVLGLIVMNAAMRIYIAQGLGCGPRDTLLVALCKRFRKIPIGAMTMIMWGIVTLIGWLLGGQLGIGTILSVALAGPILQLICNMTHFNAADVVHQNLLKSLQILLGKA